MTLIDNDNGIDIDNDIEIYIEKCINICIETNIDIDIDNAINIDIDNINTDASTVKYVYSCFFLNACYYCELPMETRI